MKLFRILLWVAIGVVIGLLLKCEGDIKTQIQTVVKRDTIYKEVIKEDIQYVPTIREVVKEVLIPVEIDTVSILKEYYMKYVYTDTIEIDSIGFAYIEDTISQNKFLSRNVSYNYNIPTIIDSITTTITKTLPPKNEFYIGGMLQANKNNIGLGPNLTMKSKKKNIYTFGYDFLNKSIHLSISKKIGK